MLDDGWTHTWHVQLVLLSMSLCSLHLLQQLSEAKRCDAGNRPTLPPLMISLGYTNISYGKASYTQLCSTTIDLSQLTAATTAQTSDGSNFIKVSAGLYQNTFKDCLPLLSQITTVSLQPVAGTTTPVSFCLDNITLTDSSLEPDGKGDCLLHLPACTSHTVCLLLRTDVACISHMYSL